MIKGGEGTVEERCNSCGNTFEEASYVGDDEYGCPSCGSTNTETLNSAKAE